MVYKLLEFMEKWAILLAEKFNWKLLWKLVIKWWNIYLNNHKVLAFKENLLKILEN